MCALSIDSIRFYPGKYQLFKEIFQDVLIFREYKSVGSVINDSIKFEDLNTDKLFINENKSCDDELYKVCANYYIKKEVDITHLSTEKQIELIDILPFNTINFSLEAFDLFLKKEYNSKGKIGLESSELIEEIVGLENEKLFNLLKICIKHRFTIHGYVEEIFDKLNNSQIEELKELLKDYDPRIYHLL